MAEKQVTTRSQLYWNTLLKIPSQIVSFVISIIVARILVPRDFGIMGIAMMLIGYTNLFTDFGFGEAIIQKGIRDKRTLNSVFTVNFVISLLLAGVFFLSSGMIADFFKSPECKNVIRVLSLVFIVTSFSAVPSAMLRRDMNFKTLSLINLSSSLLMSTITLVLALNSLGYWSLVFGQLIPSVLTALFFCYKVRWFPVFTYHQAAMGTIFNFGAWNFIKTQIGFIAQHTDKFIIGKWLGTTSLGIYDKALSIAIMPYDSLTMNINGVMYSAFSKNSNDTGQLQEHFKKSLTLISIINYPIYVGLIIIAPYFVDVLLGQKWAAMTAPFQILLVSCLFKIFGGITASLNVGVGKYREHTIRFFGAFIVFILSCFLLLRFDIVGIAYAYLIFNVVQMSLWMQLTIRSIDVKWKQVFSAILPGFLASLMMFLVTEIVAYSFLSEFTKGNMMIIIVIGMFTYCFYILFDRSRLTVELKHLIWNDIKKFSTSI